ncbi:SCO family protein [Acetobacteraceae bacterium ESL0709]|nr:SCO family protein [Acetobacteraceae bacterium ESL0697]MDF7677652.1 SCO family protein [Acetobacteraceae bacterium ESL0709]
MTESGKSIWRWTGIIGLLVFVAGLLGYGGFRLSTASMGRSDIVRSHGNPVGGSFKIVTLTGSTATDGDYRGKWFLVWFVDPRCPDERCYPPMKRLDQALAQMKQERHPIVPVVLSLNYSAPDTDDLEDYFKDAAVDYSPFYATENMTRAMTALYHAPLVKEREGYYAPAQNYVLMDPEGHYAASIPTTLSAEELHARLDKLVTGWGKQ